MYCRPVPRLWTETIETHRREVQEAIVETAGRLAISHGLLSVTMSQIAEETGIGRATLYKYFPDVESILAVWHERHVASHLAQLAGTHRKCDRFTGGIGAPQRGLYRGQSTLG
jgi:AcrR family transcriptional regulator